MEQKELDNDLFTGGFTELPGETEVTKFCSHYNLKRESILRFFAYQQRSIQSNNSKKSDQKPNFNLVLTFRSKDDQMLFREARKTNGNITVRALSGSQMGTQKDDTAAGGDFLRISNRYTPLNRFINYTEKNIEMTQALKKIIGLSQALLQLVNKFSVLCLLQAEIDLL